MIMELAPPPEGCCAAELCSLRQKWFYIYIYIKLYLPLPSSSGAPPGEGPEERCRTFGGGTSTWRVPPQRRYQVPPFLLDIGGRLQKKKHFVPLPAPVAVSQRAKVKKKRSPKGR